MPGSIKEHKPKKHLWIAKLVVILVYSLVVFMLIAGASYGVNNVFRAPGQLVFWSIISIAIALVIFYKGWDIDKWIE